MPIQEYNSNVDVCVFRDVDEGVLDAINGGWLEKKERKALDAHFDGGDVIELGSGLGIITTHVARMTDGQVYSYEADPKTAECARRTLEANDIANAQVFSKAYHPSADSVSLEREDDLFLSHLAPDGGSAKGRIEASGTSLEAIIRNHDIDNATLVCDIEGAEYLLLEEESEVLKEYIDLAFFEFHKTQAASNPQSYINTLCKSEFVWANHSSMFPVFRKEGHESESEVFSHLVVELLGKYVEPKTAMSTYSRLTEWAHPDGLLETIVEADEEEIASQVEPIRLYNQKSGYVKNLAEMIYSDFGTVEEFHEYLHDATTEEVREWLLSVKGIGPKTVEIMLVMTQR